MLQPTPSGPTNSPLQLSQRRIPWVKDISPLSPCDALASVARILRETAELLLFWGWNTTNLKKPNGLHSWRSTQVKGPYEPISFWWNVVRVPRVFPPRLFCWKKLGGSFIPWLGYVVNNHMVFINPLRIGFVLLINGRTHGLEMVVILSTYKSWDDPPSRGWNTTNLGPPMTSDMWRSTVNPSQGSIYEPISFWWNVVRVLTAARFG